jgi:hypothetical protein
MESLSEMTQWQSSDARKTALTLMHSISQSETIVGLVVLENISSIMLPTTRNLQAPSLDLIEAMSMVNDMINELTKLRSAEQFTTVFQDAKAAAELVGVELKKPRIPKRSVFRAAASGGSSDSVEDYYRINVFYPALDAILLELRMRFGPKQQVAVNFSRAIPAFIKYEDPEGDRQKIKSAYITFSDFFLTQKLF